MALTQISTQGIKDGTIAGTDLATNVDLVDNQKLRLGTGNDTEIFHNGNHFRINESAGYVEIQGAYGVLLQKENGTENLLKAFSDGAVELYHDNSKKFETTSSGVNVIGMIDTTEKIDIDADNQALRIGASQNLQLVYTGSEARIRQLDNSKPLRIMVRDGAETAALFNPSGSVELYHDNSKRIETTAFGVTVTGGGPNNPTTDSWETNSSIITSGSFGGGIAMIDGSAGFVQSLDGNGANYYLRNATTTSTPETSIKAIANGGVELYYDNSKKFETHSAGVLVSGNVYANDNNKFIAGTHNDLEIFHNGSHSFIRDTGTGTLRIETSQMNILRADGAFSIANFIGDGAVNLYFNGSRKFETTSDGINVTGRVDPSGNINFTSNNCQIQTGSSSNTLGIQGGATNMGGRIELRGGNSSGDIRMYAQATTSTQVERMRIASDGNVGIGKSSSSLDIDGSIFFGNGQQLQIVQSGSGGKAMNIRRRTNVGTLIQFDRISSVGSISCNNTSTSYNTSSDYRLKENVVTLSDPITRLKTLKAYRFNFIEDKSLTVDGFIAHEVTAVPEAITGTKDAVVTQAMIDNEEYEKEQLGDIIPQSIDQAKLVPLLVAAVQEAIGKIEVLETEVAALKAG